MDTLRNNQMEMLEMKNTVTEKKKYLMGSLSVDWTELRK